MILLGAWIYGATTALIIVDALFRDEPLEKRLTISLTAFGWPVLLPVFAWRRYRDSLRNGR